MTFDDILAAQRHRDTETTRDCGLNGVSGLTR